ncbi:hypothetical protein Patl1_30526 [Pistacia atlantica]|uniref:Uncharacterized protein n=1 Tax=Pistacia atlantica TaxID=434234 RepID=A0ACC1AAZ5_9ROSI|nr:hypothetical protein Patl1_30526 [Pistacia atlantica]
MQEHVQRDNNARQKSKQQHKGLGKGRHKKTPMEGYGVYIDTDTDMTTYNPETTHTYMIRWMMIDEHLVGSSQTTINNTTHGNDHVSQSSRMQLRRCMTSRPRK